MIDLSRTEILVGKNGIERLASSSVALFGIGGVGGYALEAVARAGVGKIFIYDFDTVQPSNFNRQILATASAMGEKKVLAAKKRIKEINPDAEVITSDERISPDNAVIISSAGFEYAIDAIDEISAKIALITALVNRNIRIVSCMGAGSKLGPGGIKVADISKTSHCPLARSVRKKLKESGITKGVRCVYSEENLTAVMLDQDNDSCQGGKVIQGNISYMPGLVGLTAAGVIIKDIIGL